MCSASAGWSISRSFGSISNCPGRFSGGSVCWGRITVPGSGPCDVTVSHFQPRQQLEDHFTDVSSCRWNKFIFERRQKFPGHIRFIFCWESNILVWRKVETECIKRWTTWELLQQYKSRPLNVSGWDTIQIVDDWQLSPEGFLPSWSLSAYRNRAQISPALCPTWRSFLCDSKQEVLFLRWKVLFLQVLNDQLIHQLMWAGLRISWFGEGRRSTELQLWARLELTKRRRLAGWEVTRRLQLVPQLWSRTTPPACPLVLPRPPPRRPPPCHFQHLCGVTQINPLFPAVGSSLKCNGGWKRFPGWACGAGGAVGGRPGQLHAGSCFLKWAVRETRSWAALCEGWW